MRTVEISLQEPKAWMLAADLNIPGLRADSEHLLVLRHPDADPQPLNTVLQAIARRSLTVQGIQGRRSSLEDIFRAIMDDGARDGRP